jgi:hypothetical protein
MTSHASCSPTHYRRISTPRTSNSGGVRGPTRRGTIPDRPDADNPARAKDESLWARAERWDRHAKPGRTRRGVGRRGWTSWLAGCGSPSACLAGGTRAHLMYIYWALPALYDHPLSMSHTRVTFPSTRSCATSSDACGGRAAQAQRRREHGRERQRPERTRSGSDRACGLFCGRGRRRAQDPAHQVLAGRVQDREWRAVAVRLAAERHEGPAAPTHYWQFRARVRRASPTI